MIVDSHIHVWPLDEKRQPPAYVKNKPTAPALVEWLVEDMEKYHIDRAVLIQASVWGWDNSYMFECLERYPGLFKAMGLVDPLSDTCAEDLRALMKDGLSGIRLHPLYYPELPCWIDSPRHERLWQVAEETSAILQFHMLPWHAVPLARMVDRHPTVRVIVDHLGKPDVTEAPPYPSYQPVLDLARRPLVWIKIGDVEVASKAGYPWRDVVPFVCAAKEAFGPGRMVWGTDQPGAARRLPLEQKLHFLREELRPCVSPAELDQILGSTPKALFGF